MKAKDKKLAKYEMENRKALKEIKYFHDHVAEYFRIINSDAPRTEEQQELVRRIEEHLREKTEAEEDEIRKRNATLIVASGTKREDDLKRKKFEKAMKAAADKQKREKDAAEKEKKNNEDKTE